MLSKRSISRILSVTLALLVFSILAACASETSNNVQTRPSFFSDAETESGNQEISPTNTVESTATNDSAEVGDQDQGQEVPIAEPSPVAINQDPSPSDFEGIEVGFTDDGHAYRGNPDASIIIQEFSDYQCPYCARFYQQTLPSILENQIASGEAILVYYDFPLSSIHPQAAAAANAARCAGEQGADLYWAMHNLLFDNVESWASEEAESAFLSFGQTLEVDIESFEACVVSNNYGPEVDADLIAGRTLGISGTPSFVINGQLLVGAVPLAQFEAAIETVKAGGQLASTDPEPQEQPQAAPTPAVLLSDYAATMGDPDAPVKIVEFTDYQCPYCSRHSLETLPQIVANLIDTGRVFYAQKDLPLDQLHPNARTAASAARCAADQEAYWEMHDLLFANQAEWSSAGDSTVGFFSSYAADIGLDEGSFSECLESGRHDAAVEANVREARSLGVSSTPFFFVDGYPLNGARPFEIFELAVQYAEEGRLEEAYAPPPQATEQPSGPRDVSIDGAYSIGDPGAVITIVEFTDYQCPFCSRHFTQTYPQLVEEYVEQGLVYYVFKDFPLNSIHPQAAKAAEAARCAGDQGDYSGMHDLLFSNQSEWSGQQPTSIFIGYAQELGIDTGVFSECLESGIHASAVNADLQQGIQLGVTGTPAFFINGYPISGAQPYELFQQAIDSLLGGDAG